MAEPVDFTLIFGERKDLTVDRRRTVRRVELQEGDSNKSAPPFGAFRAYRAKVRPFMTLKPVAGVEFDMLRKGKRTYKPRSQIPLNETVDAACVGHVNRPDNLEDVRAAMKSLQTQVTGQSQEFQSQLTEQRTYLDGKLTAVSKELDRTNTELNNIHELTTVPYIRNVTAHCLNSVRGLWPPSPRKAACTFFADNRQGKAQAFIQGLYGSDCGLKRAADTLDAMITQRNSTEHFGDDRAGLQSAVQRALRFITESSAISLSCQQEMKVLNHFASHEESFKAV